MSGLIYGQTAGGKMVPLQVNDAGQLVVSGAAGGGSGGTSDTTEVTQLAVKVAVQSIDAKTPAAGAARTVTAAARTCTGRETIPLAAGVVTTLTVPGGSIAAAIQADGNTVRVTLNGATAPSATVGTRIDDGVIYYVDTALASVKLFAAVACSAQVAYFDKA
ncbi:hypothetical protein [Zoogloea sp.]|uniref:hypothetical protein n=1 Tax=Zoogloea sp. TaxID=49181 RepID=UPI002605180C|nr:hypothetical protein [Zoogloea sp.]